MKSSSNPIFKWLLRVDYFFYFLIGVALASVGVFALITDKKLSNITDFNNLIIILNILFGFAFIIIAFYRKNQSERFITKKKL